MNIRDPNGYSLLELLVALAIMAIIATMMAAVTQQLHPLRQIQARYDMREVSDNLVRIIADDLKSAVPLPLLGDEERHVLIGSKKSIRFVAVVKTGFRTEGLREVSYSLEAQPDGSQKLIRKLVLRRFASAEGSTSKQTDVLFDPVQSLTLRYMDRDQDNKPIWVDGWDRPIDMPFSVQVVLGTRTSDDLISSSQVVTWTWR